MTRVPPGKRANRTSGNAPNHMSDNPTYRDLAAQSDDNFRVADYRDLLFLCRKTGPVVRH